MFATHPHGLWAISGPFGAGMHGGKLKLDVLLCVHWLMFKIPFVRDLVLWVGGVDVSHETISKLIKAGKMFGLAPGGQQEMLLSDINRLDIYLEHKGFLKKCWHEKCPLVPVFCCGENRVFWILDIFPRIRRWTLRTFRYLPTIFFGPFPTDLKLYIGIPVNPNEFEKSLDFKKAYYTQLFSLISKYETYELSEHLENAIKTL